MRTPCAATPIPQSTVVSCPGLDFTSAGNAELLEPWRKTCAGRMHQLPPGEQGGHAPPMLDDRLRGEVLVHVAGGGHLGTVPPGTTLDELVALIRRVHPLVASSLTAIAAWNKPSCSSRGGWTAFCTQFRSMIKANPATIGKRSEDDHIGKIVATIAVFDAKLCTELYERMIDTATAPKTAEGVLAIVTRKFGSKSSAAAAAAAAGRSTDRNRDRDRDRDRDRKPKDKPTAGEHGAKAVRLATLQANLQAKVDGNCSMCNATDHVAEPGACTEVDEHISSGGPWCTHCSMTNHATDDCGTLHGSSSRGGRSDRSGRGGRGGRGGRNGRGAGRGARGKTAATATLHKLQAQVLALEAKGQQQPEAPPLAPTPALTTVEPAQLYHIPASTNYPTNYQAAQLPPPPHGPPPRTTAAPAHPDRAAIMAMAAAAGLRLF